MKSKSFWILIIVLAILFLGWSLFNNNKAKFFAYGADYYYKKGEIEKAQEMYEKSFSLGFDDYKRRDIYVNTLINSPFTLDSQEKLVNFINFPIEDSAKLKAEYFLYDIKRGIHNNYPNNYIAQTVHNQKVLRWGNLPITYGFVLTEEIPTDFIREIETAFLDWERVLKQQLIFSRDDDNPNIIISFITKNPADIDKRKHVVAYTTPIISGNILKNMEIKFYLKNPYDNYYSANQIYNTALHEIAHALGFMGHSNDREDIMFITKDSNLLEKDLRDELREADINTILLLYRTKPDITNVSTPVGEYLPYFVLGNEEEVVSAKIREAKIYVESAPSLPSGYMDLAEAYVTEKKFSEAVKCLEKALRLADTDEVKEMIYYNLAITNYLMNKFNTAQNYLNKSMQIKDSDEKHYLLSEIYLQENKIQDAIKELKMLIENNPHNVEYTIALTNIYVNERKYFKARDVLKNYIIKNPQDKNNGRFAPYGIIRLFL